MNAYQLTKYLNRPDLMDRETIGELEAMIEKYPFFINARILLLKAYKTFKEESKYNELLPKVASQTPDRKLLYTIIHEYEPAAGEEPFADIIHHENPAPAFYDTLPVSDDENKNRETAIAEISEEQHTVSEQLIDQIITEETATAPSYETPVETELPDNSILTDVAPPPSFPDSKDLSVGETSENTETLSEITDTPSDSISESIPFLQTEETDETGVTTPSLDDIENTSPELSAETETTKSSEVWPTQDAIEIAATETEIVNENSAPEVSSARSENTESANETTAEADDDFYSWLQHLSDKKTGVQDHDITNELNSRNEEIVDQQEPADISENNEDATAEQTHLSDLNETADEEIIESYEDESEDANAAGENTDDIKALIDRFITTNPSISRPKSEFFSAVNKARQSEEESEDVATETLAKIYLSQNLYERAIHIYEKLLAENPDRSMYYNSRISEINNLKNK